MDWATTDTRLIISAAAVILPLVSGIVSPGCVVLVLVKSNTRNAGQAQRSIEAAAHSISRSDQAARCCQQQQYFEMATRETGGGCFRRLPGAFLVLSAAVYKLTGGRMRRKPGRRS
mgnify:CR=1 FL=1